MKKLLCTFILLAEAMIVCGAPFYGSTPVITGGFGVTLGSLGKNGTIRCPKKFRNFTECRLKVTDKDKQIYFIESVYRADSILEAQKEYTITVEALRKKYQSQRNRSARQLPLKIRTDQYYAITLKNRKVICRRINNTVIISYEDQAVIRAMQAQKNSITANDLAKEVSSAPLDAI